MGHVYIIRMGDTNYFKVGISRDVNERLASLQTATPFALTLVDYAEQENSLEVERDIHRALREYQVRNEWFQCDETHIRQVFRDFNMMASIDSALESTTNDLALARAWTKTEDQVTVVRRFLELGRSANAIVEAVGGNRNDMLKIIALVKEGKL